jgi:hypothetical protein
VAYVLTQADIVWNRALTHVPGTGVGDRHLHALAAPYGRIMNGGVASVMDCFTAQDVERAADALAYLGLVDMADLTRRLVWADWSEDHLEQRLNHAFYSLDRALEGAFEYRYATFTSDFEATAPDGLERRPGSWSRDPGDERKVCLGELLVHERAVLCSRADACPDPGRSTLHSRSSLHSGTLCELCPSGPTWAWPVAPPR